MIKIIKEGNPQRKVKRIFEYECAMCGCVFKFEREDTEHNYFGDVSIQCPCCKKNLGVNLYNIKSTIVEVDK